MQFKHVKLSAAMAALALSSALPAHADVTVVATMTTSGGRPGAPGASKEPATSTETIYYKGKKMRVESQGSVILFDGATNSTFILNPADKSYITFADMTAMTSPLMAMMKFSTTANVSPTGKTRTIAGHLAKEYSYTSAIDMMTNPGAMAGLGMPQKAGAPTTPMHVGTIQASGDYWVTTISSLPDGGSGAIKATAAQFSTMIPGMKPLMDKLAGVPGIPLASRETAVYDMKMGPSAAAGGKAPSTVKTIEATSIKETPLADSIFAIPAGYKKTDMSAMFGGKGGLGGARKMPAQ